MAELSFSSHPGHGDALRTAEGYDPVPEQQTRVIQDWMDHTVDGHNDQPDIEVVAYRARPGEATGQQRKDLRIDGGSSSGVDVADSSVGTNDGY